MAHPRRVYFFLTITPRQPIPEFSNPPTTSRTIISPSISSGFEEEEVEERKRDVVSPSPEVDLAAPLHEESHVHAIADLTFPMDDFTFEEDDSLMHSVSNNNRAPSPPLEQDEKEFTQTATVMQQRKQSEQAERQLEQDRFERQPSTSSDTMAPPSLSMSIDSIDSVDSMSDEDDNEESTALRNQEAAAMLFGNTHGIEIMDFVTISPMLKPQQILRIDTTPRKDLPIVKPAVDDIDSAWGDFQSPETIELAELDDMLGAF